MIQVLHQFSERQHSVGLQLLGADIIGNLCASIGSQNALRVHMPVEDVPGLLRSGDEVLNIVSGNSMVERVGGGHCADQNEHDKAHAFLSVVGAVRKADSGACQQQQGADGPWRRLVTFGCFVEGGVLDKPLGNQHEERRRKKTDQRRNQQHFEDFAGLCPVHAGGAAAHIEQLVGDAHADNGSDHGVGAGGRQPEPPCAQVPYDGGDQQGEDHGVTGAGADLQNQFDRQQGDDGEGHSAR